MCKSVLDEEIKKVIDALLDPDKYHLSIEHGAEVQQEILKKFGVDSLEQAIEYMKKAVEMNFDHVKERFLEVLLVAEKRNIAREFAKGLSNGQYEKRPAENGHMYYVLKCSMFKREANVRVISTDGHFQTHDFVEKEQIAKRLRAKIVHVPCEGRESFPSFLEERARGCHAVVFCLDNDMEGEAICFQVLDHIKKHIVVPPNGNPMDYVFRARFSSTTEILNAVQNLGRLDVFRYSAVECKHHNDLLMGAFMSGIQTLTAKDAFNLKKLKLAFGPCLAPCLKLVADSFLCAENSPVQYCLPFHITVIDQELVFHSRPMDEDGAKKWHAALKDNEYCQVMADPKIVECFVFEPPAGLNTVELLEYGCKFLKLSPVVVACIIQKLYELGFLTYPRSETTMYPISLKIYVEQLFGNLLKLMASDDMEFILDMCLDVEQVMGLGVDKGDHPPVMPTGKVLSDDDFKRLQEYAGQLFDKYVAIYHFVVRRLLASFMDAYRYFKETVTFVMGGHKLEFSYFRQSSPGFTRLLPEHQVNTPPTDLLAKLVSGAEFKVKVSVEQCPRPSLLHNHDMVRQMEKQKIGTDGSIPNHIANIQKEGYAKTNPKTDEVEPTPLGLLMNRCYEQCIPEMVKPENRAKFIQGIEEIATGKRDFVTFYNETIRELYANALKFEESFPAFVESVKNEMHLLILNRNYDIIVANEEAKKTIGAKGGLAGQQT